MSCRYCKSWYYFLNLLKSSSYCFFSFFLKSKTSLSLFISSSFASILIWVSETDFLRVIFIRVSLSDLVWTNTGLFRTFPIRVLVVAIDILRASTLPCNVFWFLIASNWIFFSANSFFFVSTSAWSSLIVGSFWISISLASIFPSKKVKGKSALLISFLIFDLSSFATLLLNREYALRIISGSAEMFW